MSLPLIDEPYFYGEDPVQVGRMTGEEILASVLRHPESYGLMRQRNKKQLELMLRNLTSNPTLVSAIMREVDAWLA